MGSILEGPGGSKNLLKIKKSCSGRFWNALKIFDRLGENIWGDFGRFCMDFRWILEGIVEELASMIRATRGRSMDGWMDGWMEKT